MDSALLILRLVGGLLVAGHGGQKLFGWVGGPRLKRSRGGAGGRGVRPPPRRRGDDDGDRQGALAEDLGERRRDGPARRLSVRGSRGGDHGSRRVLARSGSRA